MWLQCYLSYLMAWKIVHVHQEFLYVMSTHISSVLFGLLFSRPDPKVSVGPGSVGVGLRVVV